MATENICVYPPLCSGCPCRRRGGLLPMVEELAELASRRRLLWSGRRGRRTLEHLRERPLLRWSRGRRGPVGLSRFGRKRRGEHPRELAWTGGSRRLGGRSRRRRQGYGRPRLNGRRRWRGRLEHPRELAGGRACRRRLGCRRRCLEHSRELARRGCRRWFGLRSRWRRDRLERPGELTGRSGAGRRHDRRGHFHCRRLVG